MAGSTFGNIFKITTFGESHGAGVGVIVDGCPAGLLLDASDIQKDLDRRKPGQSKFTTQRKEDDEVEILSGVFEGKTLGTPICLLIRNTSQRSKDYGAIKDTYRPGHADFGFDAKYGFRDYRGGGRSSGRETAARVAAGAIAKKALKELGINVFAYTSSVSSIECDLANFDLNEVSNNMLYMPDAQAAKKASELVEEMRKKGDSVGGSVTLIAKGMPAGVGEPVFDKLDAKLSQAIMSVGAVKAVEIGDGIKASLSCGSQNNDNFYMNDGKVSVKTNHAGGILGGISNGADIVLKAYFKPTPSIYTEQSTVNNKGEDVNIKIEGRHDPIIVPRAVVVVENMAAIVLFDGLLMNATSSMDKIKKLY